MRYFPSIRPSARRNSPARSGSLHKPDSNGAEDSECSSLETPLPPPNLKVKRVDYYWSRWTREWKYKNMGSKVVGDKRPPPSPSKGNNDPWAEFCFIVVRVLPKDLDNPYAPDSVFKFVIKSQYLRKALKNAIGDYPGISWTAEPLELKPELLLMFLPRIEKHRSEFKITNTKFGEDSYAASSLGILIDTLHKDYSTTLSLVQNLVSHGEITYDLLWAIMVPGTTLLTTSTSTGEPRAVKLTSVEKKERSFGPEYDLVCESIDAVGSGDDGSEFTAIESRLPVPPFEGTSKISALVVYPLEFHPQKEAMKRFLSDRGRKWYNLKGIHHVHYKGLAPSGNTKTSIKYNLDSRIMVDRAMFRKINPRFCFPEPKSQPQASDSENDSDSSLGSNEKKKGAHQELIEHELLLASPFVYGFSLADKLWLMFSVDKITPIQWNTEAFANLVLSPDRKSLLQSLVESHHAGQDFDDFIKGKGQGLVLNLHGPPGVGKTMSAEATSEHVKRPLYVIGAGDLGTTAEYLDSYLEEVFEIATAWKAIVLIDEADVFLEQRSLRDLKRNAMVAVFLRHLEYYRGILFLTTNRVVAFDEAFLSRIHVSLHFKELSVPAKMQVWAAFLRTIGVIVGPDSSVTEDELRQLSERDINGRQIKNATRTANSLALNRGQKVGFVHLTQTLGAMEEFSADFHAMKQ